MNVRLRRADPSIMTRDRGTNMSLHQQYQRIGYNFQLGPKDLKVRIPALGQLIHSRQFVLTRECARTFEAIKSYKWEDLTASQRARGEDPKEAPIKKGDHLVDCGQYIASNWVKPLTLAAPRVSKSPQQEFAEEATRLIRSNIRRQRLPTMAPGNVY